MPHPLSLFRYCPVCGSSEWTVNDFKSKRCNACGFTYYANSSAANVALILNERDELLVVRRKKDPAKGTLDLPGGFADIGETAEEGVIREVKEETGLTVTRVSYLFSIPNRYLYSGMVVHTLDLFFRCHVTDTRFVTAMDDADEALWIPFSHIHPEDFGLDSIREGVIRFLHDFSPSRQEG